MAVGTVSGRRSLGTALLLAQRSPSWWPSLASLAVPWLWGTPHPPGTLPITPAEAGRAPEMKSPLE